MKSFVFILALLVTPFSFAETSDERLTRLEEKLDELELNQAFNKLNFSGSFLNQYESLSVDKKETDLAVPLAASSEDVDLAVFLMRVDLNFDVKVNSSINFYSTLGMSKFWNLSNRSSRDEYESSNFKSLNGGYAFESSKANFDVAFVTYHGQNSPWTIAVGRMTTNNGPPHNQLDGLGRTGTYPFMAYNLILDGAAFIYDFGHMLPKTNKLKTRLFYTPFSSVDSTNKADQTIDTTSGESVDSRADFMTLLTEYSYTGLSWVKKFNLYHTIFTSDGFYDETRQDPTDDDIEYNGATTNTVYIGFDQIAGTRLNFGYSYAQYIIRGDNFDEVKSNNQLYNMNYTFDNKSMAGHIFGVEYLMADDGKIPTDSTTTQVSSIYNIYNGAGTHVFYTIPVGRSQIFRFGSMNYTKGESETFYNNIEEKAQAYYARWKVFF